MLGAVERLRVQGVDGILVITPQEGAADALVNLPAGVPLVAVEAGRPNSVPLVAVDQFAGAVDATKLLLDLGHRTAWHVAGPRDFLEAQQRIDGWRSTLEAAGAEVPPVLFGDWSPRSGFRLGQQLAKDPEVTAIFVANDQMALGVLRALHERGREIPARDQRRRLRRHPRGAVLHAAADHRAPGLQRDGAQQPAPAARAHAEHRASAAAPDDRPRARGAPQHRPAAQALSSC